MIRTLRLESYRGFDEYELIDLARVNLLVGPNNCGKTAVLEAVELLASRGHPDVLVESLGRRGESHAALDEDGRRVWRYPVHHHFHGHGIGQGSWLNISADDGQGWVRIHILDESGDLFDGAAGPVRPFSLRIERGGDKKNVTLRLDEGGSISLSSPGLRSPRFRASRTGLPPTQFVTAESLRASEMAGVWDQVVVEGRESEVEDVMKILQPDLRSLHFLTGGSVGRAGGILLGFGPGAPRTPIGSYGDGMRRLLAVSLSLVRSAGGFLLIDEIDTGLHWTVMEAVWKLVIEAALESSIQVFATTHSLDCVIGLASFLRERPELTEEVSVQKIERRLDRSVSFGGEDIVAAQELGVEMR